MLRILYIVVTLALSISAVSAPQSPKAAVPAQAAPAASVLSFRFIGNQSFAISDGRTTLVTDFPYQSGYSDYMTYDWNTVRPSGDVIALITHRHRDHFAAELFAQTNWRIVGPRDVTASLPQNRVIPLSSAVEVAGVRIKPIGTPHANLEHYSYLVEWHGVRMYFVGDTDNPGTLLAQRGLDVAFVTTWLYRAVQRRGATIDARKIVIYHHQSWERVPQCDRCVAPAQNSVFEVPIRP